MYNYMVQDQGFKYSSPYLWWIYNKMNLKERNEIQDFVKLIQEWLSANVVQDGIPLYKWSSGKLVTPIYTGVVSNVLYFKHEEDLLAFKLKFGIGS